MINILNVSQEIKRRRLNKEYTQVELSKYVGTTQQSISGIEKGDFLPDITQLIKICHALNCTPNDILGFTSETPEQEQEQGDGKEEEQHDGE